MALPARLQMINPTYPLDQEVRFKQFPRLPAELRVSIWQHAVQRHRMLQVDVEPPMSSLALMQGAEETPPDTGQNRLYSTTNALGNLISGRNYATTVRRSPVYSKLLRVNGESRSVALRFYRVHIPCYLLRPEPREDDHQGIRWIADREEECVRMTFYFNPEYDFLQLSTCPPAEHSLVDFFHDLKAYDPRGIGLLNLAISSNHVMALHEMGKVSEAPARASLVSTLSQLREIVWAAQSFAGRLIVPMAGFEGVKVQFNHSMPVKAATPFFDLLGPDPRPVRPDLKSVLTACSDPRRMAVKWRDIMARWGIRPAQPARQRVLFALKAEQIRDVESANWFLENEDRSWQQCQHRPNYIYHLVKLFNKQEPPVETPEEVANAVRPAIGFWLFPIEALGAIDDFWDGMKMVYDLSDHWPELALSCLP